MFAERVKRVGLFRLEHLNIFLAEKEVPYVQCRWFALSHDSSHIYAIMTHCDTAVCSHVPLFFG